MPQTESESSVSDQLQTTTSAIGATVINGAQVGMLVTVYSTGGLERNLKKAAPSNAASYGAQIGEFLLPPLGCSPDGLR